MFECTVNGSLQMVVKKICKIKTNLSEIRKALNLPPPLQLNSAAVYVLQYSSFWNHKAKSYGIKTTSYGIKSTRYGIKTTSYDIKTSSYARKTTSYAFKTYKFDS